MCTEKEAAVKRNEEALNDLSSDFWTIEANIKIADNYKQPLATTQDGQNQKLTNTEGLEKLLWLKIGAKVILTVNLDAEDRLINGETENISNIEFAHGSVRKVYVNVSDERLA